MTPAQRLPRLTAPDLHTLSDTAAKWPWPAKVMLGCALAAVVWLAGDAFYLGVSRERLQTVERQGAALQQHIADKTALAATLERRTEQLQAQQQRFAAMLRRLPVEADVPGLLDDIARLAAANGLTLTGVTPLDEQPRSQLIEQPVQVAVTGAYHDLAAFVAALGGLSRLVTLHDLALQAEGELLHLELLAKTYRHASPLSWQGKAGEPFVPGPQFVYDSTGLRDPFRPPALQVEPVRGRPALAPDLKRQRGVLENVALDQFKMVGTLSRGAQTFALLRAASAVHRLAVGDYLGPDHGRVTAIHDTWVELVELFPDEHGAWLERPRTLELNVNS